MDKKLGNPSFGLLLGIGVGLALGVSQDNIGLGVGVGVALAAAFSRDWQKREDSNDEADIEKAENGGDN